MLRILLVKKFAALFSCGGSLIRGWAARRVPHHEKRCCTGLCGGRVQMGEAWPRQVQLLEASACSFFFLVACLFLVVGSTL
jgi:hypothetical protein